MLDVLDLPIRDGNFISTLFAYVKYARFRPSYKGWKPSSMPATTPYFSTVLDLPIRDGNSEAETRIAPADEVLDLPIRDGNDEIFNTKNQASYVLDLPIRDGNKKE